MSRGRLYGYDEGQFATDVNYRLHGQSATNWWGELTPIDYRPISDGGGYTIELEDNRKSQCYLRKRINGAVSGMPPRFIYHFVGAGPLE